jgi:polysaccharide biosynthesis PFTS motif protein
MTHYFYNFSYKILSLKRKGNQVYFFNRATDIPVLIRALGKIPFVKNKLSNLFKEDIFIGSYKGLYYKIGREATECTDFVYKKLKLEDYPFTKVYNKKFQTKKIEPFVLKWVSLYILELLNFLYKVHLDKPSEKVLYLGNTPLNRYIYEWWHQTKGNQMQARWLKKSELMAGLATITSMGVLHISKFLNHGFCLPVRPKKFKIMKEAVWGLRNPVFRDDFLIDNQRLLKKDLLLYTSGASDEGRMLAYQDAQTSEYECINRNELKIPINLLCRRLFKYHFLLPMVFVLRNFRSKQNYLFKEWLNSFHKTAINYEILLSHYQIGLELSVKEAGLTHIPETIILNNYGAKNVIFHWSDSTSYDAAHQHYKSFNILLLWGKAHARGKRYFVDSIIETGCWLKHNFNELTSNKKIISQKLGLPMDNRKVLSFYDETFHPDGYFTEEILLDFWQVMLELIEKNLNVIGIMKPKVEDERKRSLMSDRGIKLFSTIKQRCLESARLYFIDNPREVAATEVIAISDVNITMGMGSPSTIALLCGKTGLYYDTTGNDHHPFAQKYKNKIVFDNKRELVSTVNKIINEGYNPLNEIEPELLEDYDSFRDDRGLERFREALLAKLEYRSSSNIK